MDRRAAVKTATLLAHSNRSVATWKGEPPQYIDELQQALEFRSHTLSELWLERRKNSALDPGIDHVSMLSYP